MQHNQSPHLSLNQNNPTSSTQIKPEVKSEVIGYLVYDSNKYYLAIGNEAIGHNLTNVVASFALDLKIKFPEKFGELNHKYSHFSTPLNEKGEFIFLEFNSKKDLGTAISELRKKQSVLNNENWEKVKEKTKIKLHSSKIINAKRLESREKEIPLTLNRVKQSTKRDNEKSGKFLKHNITQSALEKDIKSQLGFETQTAHIPSNSKTFLHGANKVRVSEVTYSKKQYSKYRFHNEEMALEFKNLIEKSGSEKLYQRNNLVYIKISSEKDIENVVEESLKVMHLRTKHHQIIKR
jgi:hypothetical protein